MKRKYNEIFKLKKMLEEADIPFDWIENWGYEKERVKQLSIIAPDLIERYQICYPKGSFKDTESRWISVIQGFGTYGAENDRLEIMGGLTPWERFECGDDMSVIGYLTARNVFNRIKKNWEENKSNE